MDRIEFKPDPIHRHRCFTKKYCLLLVIAVSTSRLAPSLALLAGFFGAPAVTALALTLAAALGVVVTLALLRLTTAIRILALLRTRVYVTLLPGLAVLLRVTALVAFVLIGCYGVKFGFEKYELMLSAVVQRLIFSENIHSILPRFKTYGAERLFVRCLPQTRTVFPHQNCHKKALNPGRHPFFGLVSVCSAQGFAVISTH